ncbi:fimbrial biogenesis chaperone [Dysgonomonas macrotermitis]|uniref:P pilus assembly protein, chaperone PapD n=1 Tax=Dysgonomonas macrotermitis TaxID=1346286 RepID=A0A1M5GK41_9BACT|nr:hypothetical protein [Dysgonomonas macrotermitis]SHG03891.1 hypothetical protein SAMN05444362_11436 [Dysgonomonas macrotermitis]
MTKTFFPAILFFIAFLTGSPLTGLAQTGISVSPPRVYFEADPGQTTTEQVVVTNVSAKTVLELAVTLADWQYDEFGQNMIYQADTLSNSCASWVNLNGNSYLSLKPGESKTLDISITAPEGLTADVPVHTAMLYVTQMNPVDDIDEHGANIKVSVRSGIKLFQRTSVLREKKIEIVNLTYNKDVKHMLLMFNNDGNVWTDGNISVDLFNKTTGKETQLENIVFYSMPGDKRNLIIQMPGKLEKGNYTATILIDYGDDNNMEAAELAFAYE